MAIMSAATGNNRWLYQVQDPQSGAWITRRQFLRSRQIVGVLDGSLTALGYGRLSLGLENGRPGTAARVCDIVTGDAIDITAYVLRQRSSSGRRPRPLQRLQQRFADYEYRVVTEMLSRSDDRYYLVVERSDDRYNRGVTRRFWQPAERTRPGIPRGYKTLRRGVLALWKRHEGKGSALPRYALIDCHGCRVIDESTIDMVKFLHGTRLLLRRNATVAMLEQLIPEDPMRAVPSSN